MSTADAIIATVMLAITVIAFLAIMIPVTYNVHKISIQGGVKNKPN